MSEIQETLTSSNAGTIQHDLNEYLSLLEELAPSGSTAA